MQECHYELIKELIEIEILKKDFYSKEAFAGTLSHCKREMLESYVYAASDLLLGYAHIFHELEGVHDTDTVDKRIAYLNRLFYRAISRNLRKHRVSKLYYFFCLFRNTFEEELLTECGEEIKDHFRDDLYTDTPRVAYERILTKFYNQIELAYLFMSGLQINCDSVKSDVYDSKCYHIYKDDTDDKLDSICEQDEPCTLKVLSAEVEYVHFFILPEYRETSFIDLALKTVLEVHKSPNTINLIVDYKLHPTFKYTKANYDNYLLAKDIFNDVKLVNSGHIEFGEFEDHLDITPPDYHDAVKSLMQRSRREGKVPLTGEILTSVNAVGHPDMMQALQEQQINPEPLGELLKGQGKISEDDINAALLIQDKCKEDLDSSKTSQLISSDEVERLLKQTSGIQDI